MDDNLSDLLRDYKLETRFDKGQTIHVFDDPDAPPSSPQRLEHWKKSRTLGYGGQGRVILQACTSGSRSHTQRAVKMIRLHQDDGARRQYKRELEALIKFSHDKYARYFAKMLGWYASPNTLYITMEYFPIGDLQTYIDQHARLLEDDCCLVISQLLQSLATMHKESFAHRDVKPRNVLIHQCPPDPWWVKLADFGIAKKLAVETSGSSKWIGTLLYMAPELLRSDRAGKLDINYQVVDMWALGITTFFILTKTLPFRDPYAAIKYARDPDRSFPRGSLDNYQVSEDGHAFVRALIRPQPKERLGSEAAKRHAWIRSWLPEVPTISDVHSGSSESSRRNSLNDDVEMPTYTSKVTSQIYSNAWSDEVDLGTADHPGPLESSSGNGVFEDGKQRPTKISEETFQIYSKASSDEAGLGIADHPRFPKPSSRNRSLSGEEEIPPMISWDMSEVRTLHDAAKHGLEEAVDQFLKNGADVSGRDDNGWAPIHLAAQNGHVGVVRLLVEKGANLEAEDGDGNTLLIWAVGGGYKDVVRMLLEKDAALDAKNQYGNTPLIQATYLGHKDVVQMLLEKGAALEAKDQHGNTPLIQAACLGNKDVVRMLLEKDAALEAKNQYGNTPLLCAASYGHSAVVQMLLEKGATLEARDQYGNTALLRAASLGYKDTVQMLLEKGAALEAKGQYGYTPLLFAIGEGHKDIVQLLLEKGATLEVRDQYGNTELLKAASLGYKDTVQMLLEKGAALEAKNLDGNTPLLCAASKGHKVVERLLLEKGAKKGFRYRFNLY